MEGPADEIIKKSVNAMNQKCAAFKLQRLKESNEILREAIIDNQLAQIFFESND